jgi:hypothetical protein
MAITIPISTNTTIATCIHTHVGDIREPAYRAMCDKRLALPLGW